jgi:hypothetical protein
MCPLRLIPLALLDLLFKAGARVHGAFILLLPLVVSDLVKPHPTLLQTVQPFMLEKSAASFIFPVFLCNLKKYLPKCKVAHSIRQSYLYKTSDNNDVNSEISNKYPLPYYYIRKQNVSSFYYNKNDLIAYYYYSTQNNDFYVMPLYNYLKNDYEIVLSDFEYNLFYPYEACLVRAPNRQLYMCARNIIANVSKGTLLYDLNGITSYWFLSMPIGNSFFFGCSI